MFQKIIYRTIIILMAAGLTAGGIYLFAENAGAGLLQTANMPSGRGTPGGDGTRAGGKGMPPGSDITQGERPARPGSEESAEGDEFTGGGRSARPDMDELAEDGAPSGASLPRGEGGRHDQGGFSLQGLGGVALQAGKIAIITALVVIVQAIVNLIRRRRQQPASPTAV